ncbi:MAG TPA: hypothetical protein VGF24_07750 [Vicinamibacterales bacterium]
MPLDSLPDSSIVDPEDGTALFERLRNLERLLTEVGTAQPPGDLSESGAREALVSPRLRPFTEEIQHRLGTKAWDVADVLTARLLLEELNASLRGCRAVANAVSSRLRDTHRRLKEGRLKLEREAARRSKEEAARSSARMAAKDDSTD